jgi:hypothetical protein
VVLLAFCLPACIPASSLPDPGDEKAACFDGSLPCDGCPGTRVRLKLDFERDRYALEEKRLGSPSPPVRYEQGTFREVPRPDLSGADREYLLEPAGRGEPRRFWRRSATELEQLDPHGRRLAIRQDHSLFRGNRCPG